ncbi:MAG: polyprenyl synthetase family protein, partial [Candidatus Nanohaloarchaea archaeon]|nr:polyprenyl synthetase family protein [Candidatus Nanohaloarchaea archaeon]
MTASSEFEAFHDRHYEVVNQYLDEFFDTLQRQHTSDRKQETVERFREFVLRGGKRLRPISVLLGYGAVTGNDPSEQVYRLSLPVEIYHNGTLIQDDLMDQDDTRRGGPAYHQMVMGQYSEWLPAPALRSQAV